MLRQKRSRNEHIRELPLALKEIGEQNMEPERAEKEGQIEEGTDAIDETAGNKQDTKSADNDGSRHVLR